MKTITPMELLTLFHKSDYEDTKLSVYEHKLMSVLLTFVNSDVSQGYKAWPATDLLIKRTGIKTTTLTTARKSLLREGFLKQIMPNAGPGRSCIYYINPEKIVELAAKAGNKASGRAIPNVAVPEPRPSHERNTSGLKNQKAKPDPVVVQHHEIEYDPWGNPEPVYVPPKSKQAPAPCVYEDDSECPF